MAATVRRVVWTVAAQKEPIEAAVKATVAVGLVMVAAGGWSAAEGGSAAAERGGAIAAAAMPGSVAQTEAAVPVAEPREEAGWAEAKEWCKCHRQPSRRSRS